ncbi:MAG: ATP-binding protein [Oscillospiraceae bacterium]|jgi:hypothetical protein|nr:ATP-binding protein [Oscillospiraceae bacterium]
MNRTDSYSARNIIEALRSGVSSREVGCCFSSARPGLTREIHNALTGVAEGGESGGRIITGKYGEGKTHLLNTVFNMAHERNMAVSAVTLSKESPLSNLGVLYPKVLQETYLPGKVQPGISDIFERLSAGSPAAAALLEYCLTKLECNKLYYVLKSYLGTQSDEEKYMLLGDIEGDFMANATVKQIYKRIYGETVVFNTPFSKTRHVTDYFAFVSRLFLSAGYDGWVILFDEAELIGRMSKKARQSAYANMAALLRPDAIDRAYCLFAFNSSYVPDVIESKHEYAIVEESPLLSQERKKIISGVLSEIASAAQLVPLGKGEILEILEKIRDYHGRAYGWSPKPDAADILAFTEKHGYLLRTRIRTAVELLDQYYQYGSADEISVGELGQMEFDEDGDPPSLDAFV